VILLNGLGFEPWAERLIRAAAAKGAVVIVSADVKPRAFKTDSASGAPTAVDPHAWQDLRNGQIYAHNIAVGLAAADKANGHIYEQNAGAYGAELAALDAKVRGILAPIPQARRRSSPATTPSAISVRPMASNSLLRSVSRPRIKPPPKALRA